MPEEYENAIEWLDGQKTATVTVHSQKQKTALLRLAKAHPDKVTIKVHPHEPGQDGTMIVHLPVGWIQFKAPKELSEKQLERSKRGAEKMNSRWRQEMAKDILT